MSSPDTQQTDQQTESATPNLLQWIGLPQAEPPWSLLDAALALFALMVAMTIIATAIALNVSGTDASTTPPRDAFLLGWAVAGFITVAFVLIRWRRTPEMWQAMRMVSPRLGLPIVALMGVAAAFAIDLAVGTGNGAVQPVAIFYGLGSASNQWLLAAVFAVVAQPVAEGLVFFGVLQARLRASFGAWPGYLLTIVLFTAYHALIFGAQLPDRAALWYGVVYPALVAAFLGAMRIRLGSTLAVIIAYAAMGITTVLAGLALIG
ncbi:CPBP family intramembrane metalloprotease [Phototrophicus methaneseepsis]|uniref:CPBP family intramembrane metalloprotease n=1 Tax=Phototrophicus methaneseepsis TaxID=2710758 RepID=A0A7S8IGF6_9CHLR|nr:CPBP family intramembrane glutamic endopeptidase [Phototrophicus methaneseepsis]QPC83968.1 CPBP family intramembrane metalloprotease [Phototrophicus methaneseepsis]